MKHSRNHLAMLLCTLLLCSVVVAVGCSRQDEQPAESTATVTGTAAETEEKTPKHGVTLSHPAGFYDEGFTLTMTSDGGTIYYTLDGSVPTIRSTKYKGPIQITDASENENLHSARTDLSTGQLEEVNAGYAVPDFKVDKCTILRAVVAYKDGTYSEIETASYFVGYKDKTGYENMNIVSLLTDPDNLFDESKGIYVRGKTYQEYVKNKANGVQKWFDPYWWWWDCNYNQKGDSTERPATVQFFSLTGKLLETKSIGIRIQGGGSRGKIPRSFNFYARETYDGTTKFSFKPFGTDYKPQRVTLFSGGDDNDTKFKDWLVNTLCADCDFCTMDFEPYTLFLDGEYWGNYWLTEKYDEEYLHNHYGVSKDNVIIVKNGGLSEGEGDDLKEFTEMRNYIKNHDMSQDKYYKRACELLDIDSYIAYYGAEIYIGRYNDWPGSNYALWRTREAEEGVEYADCKWRYMLFDVNSGAMDISKVEENSITFVRNSDDVFKSLWRNAEFRQKMKKMLLSYAENEFSPENVNARYEDYLSSYGVNMMKEFERFYADPEGKQAHLESSTGKVKAFFEKRKAVIENICASIK